MIYQFSFHRALGSSYPLSKLVFCCLKNLKPTCFICPGQGQISNSWSGRTITIGGMKKKAFKMKRLTKTYLHEIVGMSIKNILRLSALLFFQDSVYAIWNLVRMQFGISIDRLDGIIFVCVEIKEKKIPLQFSSSGSITMSFRPFAGLQFTSARFSFLNLTQLNLKIEVCQYN